MSTTTTKQPHEYLGLTLEQYDNDYVSQYIRWCQNLAKSHKVALQCLLANTAIHNYYRVQFLELEHSFKVVAQRLDGIVDHTIMLKNYDMIMVDIYTNYSPSLIKSAKKLKIENPTFNQN